MVAPEIYHKGGHKWQVEAMERDLWGTLLQGHLQDRPPYQIIKELGCRCTIWLKVPSFIKLSMVTAFHKARFRVKVEDVVIGGSEAKENAGEVIAIKFAAFVTATFDTHP